MTTKPNNVSPWNTLLCLALVGGLSVTPAHAESWIVYYSDNAPIEAFDAYKVLVLDSDFHPPLGPLLEQKKLLLGYLSLGEVEQVRHYFRKVKDEGILLHENQYWKGSYFVDVRDPRWTKRVIEELIPAILHQGFRGVFLDTLDNPPHLERQDPAKYGGMTAAATRLVRTIRRHYPTITIMMNRGYELLPEVDGHIDVLLAESFFTDYDFDTKVYSRVPPDLYQEQLSIINAAKTRQPGLRIFTLDYWDPEDRNGIAQIYREQRGNGFSPYVATIELDRIVEEPN